MPAASAHAAAKSATCATLQATLTGAVNGDVITLNSSNGPGGLCSGTYTLPSYLSPTGIQPYNQVTLQGNPADGVDGFDRNNVGGANARALSGNDIHRWEITDLSFRNGNVTGNGGAIAISGESGIGLRRLKFYNNHATAKGGAVFFSEDAAPGGLLVGFGISDSN